MKKYTTREAAEKLGYSSDAAVRTLIWRKGLKPEKIGHIWVISEKELRILEQAVKRRNKKATS